MGVPGLDGFIRKVHPTTCPRVSIADLANKYKEQTGRDSAVAAVDGRILLFVAMEGAASQQRFGGQFKEFTEAVVALAQRLKDVGVTPVFFFKAGNEDQLNAWEERTLADVAAVASAFERLPGECPKVDELAAMVQQVRIYQPPHRRQSDGEDARRGSWRSGGRPSRGAQPQPQSRPQPRGGARGGLNGPQPFRREVEDILPPGMLECAKQALKAAGYEVTVGKAWLLSEMAHYARSSDAFCVLTSDTDYLALEGARHYMSLFHLDKEAMTTLCYDRDAIASALGLQHRAQLALAFTLMPPKFIPKAWLIPLHHKMLGRPLDRLFASLCYRVDDVVDYLGRLVCEELAGLSAADAVDAMLARVFESYENGVLDRFAQDLEFRDRLELQEALRVKLESSLKSYEYTPSWTEARPKPVALEDDAEDCSALVREARARQRTARFVTGAVVPLLRVGVLEQGPALEDPGLPPRCGSAVAMRPFRRRMYGVLLRPQEPAEQALPQSVREFIVPSKLPCGAKPQPVDVQPIPPVSVPGLQRVPSMLSLWRGGEAVAEAQWLLLAWCLCPSADAARLTRRLRELPPHLALPAAALFLMMHTGALPRAQPAAAAPSPGTGSASGGAAAPVAAVLPPSSASVGASRGSDPSVQRESSGDAARQSGKEKALEWVRVTARTCVLVGKLSAKDIAALPSPRPLRMAVHVAAQFMRTWTSLAILNDILGAPVPADEVQPSKFFDGKVFHHVLTEPTVPYVEDHALVELVVLAASDPDGQLCPDCETPSV